MQSFFLGGGGWSRLQQRKGENVCSGNIFNLSHFAASQADQQKAQWNLTNRTIGGEKQCHESMLTRRASAAKDTRCYSHMSDHYHARLIVSQKLPVCSFNPWGSCIARLHCLCSILATNTLTFKTLVCPSAADQFWNSRWYECPPANIMLSPLTVLLLATCGVHHAGLQGVREALKGSDPCRSV